jgi:teichuronic acid biosynthesis glycosyltransferase TuaC
MRIVTFTTLYPSTARPQFGIFVETRLRHLVSTGRVDARVVAPCPWFPWANPAFGSYAVFAGMPRHEERHGIVIDHPRYPLLPKIGMSLAPSLLFARCLPFLHREIAAGRDFDLIDAHYMYPDGVAAVMLGKALHRPVVVTSRGTDLNIIPEFRMARQQIVWAARHAAGLVTVSEGLKQRLVALGIADERVRVLRNGVDTGLFHLGDRTARRAEFGLDGPTLLAVGNLIPLKRHAMMVEALAMLPGMRLVIIGDGPLRQGLAETARRLGVADRVTFAGRMPQERLAAYYAAADALLLASTHEGWPNVLLESMACGTPVIATPLAGAREIVGAPEAGRILGEATAAALAGAIRALLAAPPPRAATAAYAAAFGWDSTTAGQIALFEEILETQFPARRVMRAAPR